jgi:hypothetical protein
MLYIEQSPLPFSGLVLFLASQIQVETEFPKGRVNHRPDSCLQSLKIFSLRFTCVPYSSMPDCVCFTFRFKTARARKNVFHGRLPELDLHFTRLGANPDLGFVATGAAIAQEQSVPVSFLLPLQTLCANENQRVPVHSDTYQIVSAITVVVAPDTEDGACAL